MTYQGSEIRINTDNDTVTLYDEPVYSFNDFKQVYLDNQDIEENVSNSCSRGELKESMLKSIIARCKDITTSSD